ncbi:hypothetical protein Ga0100231_006300 [Opitutaceae bacterium TAV4]|nr:hypothetical protein Ga0100231_006300 [Opitutaceae bacterium TAV4]
MTCPDCVFLQSRHSNLAKNSLAGGGGAPGRLMRFSLLCFSASGPPCVARHANTRGIIGDAPIFVARDSADVWTHPEFSNSISTQANYRGWLAGLPY